MAQLTLDRRAATGPGAGRGPGLSASPPPAGRALSPGHPSGGCNKEKVLH